MQVTHKPITNYVLGFAFSKSGELVLLICKNKPEWQRGRYNGIGGKIAPGEHPDAAMSREFLEETGVAVPPTHWTSFAELRGPDYHVWVYYTFLSDDAFRGARTTTDEEIIKTGISYAIKHRAVLPNLRWLLPAALGARENKFGMTVTYYGE